MSVAEVGLGVTRDERVAIYGVCGHCLHLTLENQDWRVRVREHFVIYGPIEDESSVWAEAAHLSVRCLDCGRTPQGDR